MIITVPNFNSLELKIFKERWIAIYAPKHLYQFTPPLRILHAIEKFIFRGIGILANQVHLGGNIIAVSTKE